jgi:hypothetical protein
MSSTITQRPDGYRAFGNSPEQTEDSNHEPVAPVKHPDLRRTKREAIELSDIG